MKKSVLNLTGRTNPGLASAQSESEEIMTWLDVQSDSSVVFLCFGSIGVFSAAQIEEIARGIEVAGFRFIWAVRTNIEGDGDPHEPLPEGCVDRTMGRGIVCSWAPMNILAHRATRGFVSDCGWNSIQESLWYGVPIATWPMMYAEPQLNAFEMVKELGLVVEIRRDYVQDDEIVDEIVSSYEIAVAITAVMDGDNPIRKRVSEASAAARKAVSGGGSSMVVTGDFIRDVLGDHS